MSKTTLVVIGIILLLILGIGGFIVFNRDTAQQSVVDSSATPLINQNTNSPSNPAGSAGTAQPSEPTDTPGFSNVSPTGIQPGTGDYADPQSCSSCDVYPPQAQSVCRAQLGC